MNGRAQGLQLVPSISTFAGTGTANFSGDGGFASNAALNDPAGLAIDGSGNTFISDYYNHRIRVVDTNGLIKTAYGTGAVCSELASVPGSCGDGGPASGATFGLPTAMLFDSAGDLYIVDYGAYRVRRVDALTGNISTVAGTGASVFNGDGIAATAAGLSGPHGIAMDSAGDIYIADMDGQRVRMIAAGSGIISTIAGNGAAGYNGDGIPAVNAELNEPAAVTVDASGNVYIADQSNERVREVAAGSRQISTIAGNGSTSFAGDGGSAMSALLNTPTDVRLDRSGNLYIADSGNLRIREIFGGSGLIATVAGAGTTCSPSTGSCGDGSPATNAGFVNPAVIVLDGSNDLYIVDQAGSRVRSTSLNVIFPAQTIGNLSTRNISFEIVGAPTSISSLSVAASEGGVHEFVLGTPTGCATGGAVMNAIGTICTVAVTFKPGYPGARREPFSVVTSGGTFHFGLNGIGLGPEVMISPGTLKTVAGMGVPGYSGDHGSATSARLSSPARAIVDAAGNVFIADAGNHVVREVLAGDGSIVTVAGTGTACGSATSACGDGGASTAGQLNGPMDVAVDAEGNLYIADTGDNRVRRVDANTGVLTTVAGNGIAAYLGDGGDASAASISGPRQTVVNAGGDLYIVSAGDDAVRFVSHASNVISTVAGDGTSCSSTTAACGDGGPAGGGNSQLNRPSGIALDTSSNLYIADTGDNRVRRVDEGTGKISTVAGMGEGGYSGDGASATAAELNQPGGVFVDAAGDLYIADTNNAAIRMVPSAFGSIMTIAGNGSLCITPTAACGDAGPANTAAFVTPVSVALDSLGNLLIADSGENRAREVSILAPVINFAPTAVGSVSVDSPQHLWIYDVGNVSLNLKIPASGTNPFISAGFPLSSSSSCPQLTPSSAAAALPPGDACAYAIEFAPQTSGQFAGMLQGEENSLNAANAMQTVLLNGAAIEAGTVTSIASSVNPSAFGQTLTLSSHVTTGSTGPVPTGMVTYYLLKNEAPINLQAAPASSTTSETLALAAGSYTLSLAAGGLYTAWNPALFPSTNDQWTDRFGIELCPSCDATIHEIGNEPAFSTAAQALNAYQGASSLINLDPSTGASVQVANPYTFTLASPASVSFFVPDGSFANGSFVDSSAFWDSSGGLSLNLTTLVPIGTGSLTGAGNGAGIASLNISTLAIGTNPILAVYGGDSNYVGSSSTVLDQVVSKAVGPDMLSTTSANPNYGEAVTLTDTIPIRNGIAPTGTVTFYNGAAVIGTNTVQSAGTATWTTSSLPVGADAITAHYSGNGSYNAATAGPLTENVAKSTSSDMLQTSNAAPIYLQSVLFTVTIPLIDGVATTGSVTFYSNALAIGTQTISSSGSAIFGTTVLAPGTDVITAVYSGDSHYQTLVSNAVGETVSRLSTTSVLGSSNTTPEYGAPITLTDTIAQASGAVVTGTVSFYNGSSLLGTVAVMNGIALLTTATLPVGADTVTAVYAGSADYNPSTTPSVVESVALLRAAATLTTSNGAPTPAQAFLLTDVLSNENGVPATGTVNFYIGSMLIGAATIGNDGVATLAAGPLQSGVVLITAVYGGDGHYGPSTSNAVTEVVALLSGVDTLSATSAVTLYEQPITFTDTVPVEHGIQPTGSVTFFAGSKAIGTVGVASARASLTVSFLPVGTATVNAVYSGDTNYSSSSSNALIETVSKWTASTILTVSNASPKFGQSITLIDQTSSANSPSPTGTIVFMDGSIVIATGPLENSGAMLSTAALLSGQHSVTAAYSGDAYYNAASSPVIAINVIPLPIDFSIAATPASVTVDPGEAATFTVALGGINGAFSQPVTMTTAGVPEGMSVGFSTANLIPGNGPAITTMTMTPVHGKKTLATTRPLQSLRYLGFSLLGIPLLSIRKFRVGLAQCSRLAGLAAMLILLTTFAALNGCGGGYIGNAPSQSRITIIGTSGQLVHTTSVTLTIR